MSWKSAGFALLLISLLVVSLYRAKDGARQSEKQIAELEVQLEEALETRRELLYRLDQSAARKWLETYAETELGMSPVRAQQIVNDLNIDQMLGEPQAGNSISLTEAPEEVPGQ